jgi:hypothetical protein
MTPFEKAYAEARRKWTRGEGGPTFSFNGKPYSVATREEAARQKERSQSPERGRSYGGRADTRADSSQIPGAGASKAPASAPRARVSASDIPGLIVRGMVEGADRVPFGRGQGQMFVAAGAGRAAQAATKAAQAPRAAAPAAKRVEPLMSTSRGSGGKFVPGSSKSGGKSMETSRTYQPPMGADKKGGKSASTPGKTEPLMYTSRAQGGKFRKSEGK